MFYKITESASAIPCATPLIVIKRYVVFCLKVSVMCYVCRALAIRDAGGARASAMVRIDVANVSGKPDVRSVYLR